VGSPRFYPRATMTDDLRDGEQVQPEGFEDLARRVVEQVADLWGSGQYSPPFEIIFTDAAGRLVMGIRMDRDGDFKSLPNAPHLLRARFPLTVVLVDQNGKTWQTSVTKSDFAQ
jgi:hypothetical protein